MRLRSSNPPADQPPPTTEHREKRPSKKLSVRENLLRRIVKTGLVAKDSSQPPRRRLCAMVLLVLVLLLPLVPILSLSAMLEVGWIGTEINTETSPPSSTANEVSVNYLRRHGEMTAAGENSTVMEAAAATVATATPVHHHSIPNVIIFTHYIDLLTKNETFTDENLVLSKNIHNTISLHDTAQIRFLTDDDCIAAIKDTMGEKLSRHFQKEEKGMYKADICRGAALLQTGGLYFDADIQARMSVWDVLPHDAEFATVKVHNKSKHPGCFFNAFMAATPNHPVIRRYLEMFVEYYERERKVDGPLGVILLKKAFDDVGKREKSVFWQEVRYNKDYFRDVEPTVGVRRACHFVVAIPKTRIAVFYSRVRGSRMCGGAESMPLKNK